MFDARMNIQANREEEEISRRLEQEKEHEAGGNRGSMHHGLF